jgi:amidase
VGAAVDDDLCLAPATMLAAAIRQRTISSRELLERYLERIERLNPGLNAVVTLDVERAMEDARQADDGAATGDLGPLHGLPVTVKDAIETAGIRSTGGARELSGHVPPADAPAVARLKAAGAIVFGKTNVPRWSADIQTFNDVFGTTNNPWDRSRTPGGSSGGAAAAVSAGLTSFELGTDIGGSVRIAASYCGVFGHKPTFGVVSQRGYLDRVGGGRTDVDMNVFGPFARHAEDLDLLLSVLAAPNAADVTGWRLDLPGPRHTDISRYRIGTWLDDPEAAVDAETLTILSAAAAALAGAGAHVEEARPALAIGEAARLFDDLLLPAVSLALEPRIGEPLSGSHRAWLAHDLARTNLRQVWADWFRDYDALLCPVMPMVAFAHDHSGSFGSRVVTINGRPRRQPETLAWTGMVGVAYLPATVVPVGRTAAGLPVGMQVVGPYLEDRTALWVAARLAEVAGGYVPPPGV